MITSNKTEFYRCAEP